MKRIHSKKLFYVLTVLIFIAVCGLLAYFILLKQSPKYIYLQAEAEHYRRMVHQWRDHDGMGKELYRLAQGEPSRISSELSANVHFAGLIGSFMNRQLAGVQRGLDQTRISLVLEQDAGKAQYLLTSALFLDQAELLALEFYQNGQITAIKLPGLLEKYLILENNQSIPTIGNIFPGYQGEAKVPRLARLNQSGRLAEEIEANLLPKYGLYLWNRLTDEMFTLEKGTYQTAQGEQKGQLITLQMSGEELEALIQELLAELARDQELMALLQALEREKEVSHLFRQLGQLRFPDGLTMQVTIDKQGNILARELELSMAGWENMASNWLTGHDLPTNQWGVQLKYAAQYSLPSVSPDGRVEREKSGWRLELKPTFFPKAIVQLAVDTVKERDRARDGKTIDTRFSLSFGQAVPVEDASWLSPIAGELEIPRLRGQLRQYMERVPTIKGSQATASQSTSTHHNDNEQLQYNLDLNLYVDITSSLLGRQSLGIKLALMNKVQFTDRLLFPKIEKENALFLSQLKDPEWKQIISHLQDRLSEWWKRVARS